jgi:hypothetical protein
VVICWRLGCSSGAARGRAGLTTRWCPFQGWGATPWSRPPAGP